MTFVKDAFRFLAAQFGHPRDNKLYGVRGEEFEEIPEEITLTGQVEGSGFVGQQIEVSLTDQAISDQTAKNDSLAGTEEILGKLASGGLIRIPVSLLFSQGNAGADGADGREVELRNSGSHIQWRYVGDVAWIDLVALSAITGPQGPAGSNGNNGTNGTNGTNGREVELRVSGTLLQWRYVGDPTWITLIDFNSLNFEQIDIDLTTLNVYQTIKTFNVTDVFNFRISAFSLDQQDVSFYGSSFSKGYNGTSSVMRRYLRASSNMDIEVELNGTEVKAAITGPSISLPHAVRFKIFYE